MGVEIDMNEVRSLAVDLRGAPARLTGFVPPIVAKGAHNIKKQLRADFNASQSFRPAGRTVSYDLEDDGFSAVIGPEKRGGGRLANIAYFGGANGGGGTVADPQSALSEEEPRFLNELSKALSQSVLP